MPASRPTLSRLRPRARSATISASVGSTRSWRCGARRPRARAASAQRRSEGTRGRRIPRPARRPRPSRPEGAGSGRGSWAGPAPGTSKRSGRSRTLRCGTVQVTPGIDLRKGCMASRRRWYSVRKRPTSSWGPFRRLDGSHLREGGRSLGRVGAERGAGVDEGPGTQHPADAPARHAIGLGGRPHHHEPIGGELAKALEPQRSTLPVGELGIGVVIEDRELLLLREDQDPAHLLGCDHRACGVRRGCSGARPSYVGSGPWR